LGYVEFDENINPDGPAYWMFAATAPVDSDTGIAVYR
jgi:hypothetical protein